MWLILCAHSIYIYNVGVCCFHATKSYVVYFSVQRARLRRTRRGTRKGWDDTDGQRWDVSACLFALRISLGLCTPTYEQLCFNSKARCCTKTQRSERGTGESNQDCDFFLLLALLLEGGGGEFFAEAVRLLFFFFFKSVNVFRW